MGINKTTDLIELSPSTNYDDSPVRAVFCLKEKTDMKKIEEVEDCFILEFDPSESLDLSNRNFSEKSSLSEDADLSVIAERGQVACRDYPHPRHLCVKFPFDKTTHETHCEMCFCFVCDTAAPCKLWTEGLRHCDAENGGQLWKLLKAQSKIQKDSPLI